MTQKVHKDHFLSNALNIINTETKNFCISSKVICFPLDEEIEFNFEKDFYDGIHTRPSGNEKIAEYLFYKIKKKEFVYKIILILASLIAQLVPKNLSQ